MKFPGDLTDEERQQAFEKLRDVAVEKWSEARALAIEESLNEAAAAIARLDRLRFSRDDAPGFYLHETTGNESEAPDVSR